MQMLSYLPRVLCVITYLFAISITIWALYQPFMKTTIFYANMDRNIDIYMDKTCINNTCESNDDNNNNNTNFGKQGNILHILYIVFIVLASLCLVLSFTKYTKICNIVGLLLLGMALAVMITLIIFVRTVPLHINTIVKKQLAYNFTFTVASILVIVVCCLMIVKQLVYNGMLHSVGRAIMMTK